MAGVTRLAFFLTAKRNVLESGKFPLVELLRVGGDTAQQYHLRKLGYVVHSGRARKIEWSSKWKGR